MDYVIQFFLSALGNSNTSKWLVILMVSLSALAFCIAIYFLLAGYFDPVKKRLYTVTGNKKQGYIQETVSNLGQYFVIDDPNNTSHDRKRLLYSGYHEKNSLAHYYGIKIMMLLAMPILTFIICSNYPGLTTQTILLLVISSIAVGFILPSFYLDKKVKQRQRIIRNGFPDAIDQLIVCTEAGLGLDAGLQRVAKDTALSNNIMGYELGLVNAELRAGVNRDQALKHLVDRTGVEEIRGLVSALSQSMRFGSSIADTLRVYAEDLRDKRMQNAEEEAAKLTVKMLFPLGLCFFPGILLVILGPAMITIYSAFEKHL